MKTILIFALLLVSLPAFASAPVCMYQDVLSGPASGGEGGNGIYLNIYGTGFGASQGASTVTINGHAVAQYIVWGADPTGDRQQIGVQIASGTTTGVITVTTTGGTSSPGSFTVRSGHQYFIGSAVDNTTPTSCATMLAANSYSTPWGLTNFASHTESAYNYGTMRTPVTYEYCLPEGSTLVFLNGVNYPYFDGAGWHASMTTDDPSATSSSFLTFQARPGATAILGGEGWSEVGIRSKGANVSYSVFSGLTLIGGQTDGGGGSGLTPYNYDRAVGNTINCPACSGSTGALNGATNFVALGNVMTALATDISYLPNGADKEYHAVYFQGNNFEFGWNRVYNTAAYNGFQVNEDYSFGFYNFLVHDNDIADVNGSGINLSDIDPTRGPVKVYNNIIHHVGVNIANGGDNNDPHSCLAIKGYGGPNSSGSTPNNASSYSVTGGNTVNIVAGNAFLGGEVVGFSNMTSATFLNGQSLSVLGTGLSQGGFSVTLTHANVGSTPDTGFVLPPNASVITNGVVTTNVVTFTIANSFTVGEQVMAQGLVAFSFLNGISLTISSASGTQFSATIPTHANVASTADSGFVLPTASANLYNNTMYDCSSYLNINTGSAYSCAVLLPLGQPNVTTNMVNNVVYQPTYAGTSAQNVYACGATVLTGTNNFWYSATTPGSTAIATGVGTITNPLYATSANGPWTNYNLQSGSPARGAGSTTRYPTTDFIGYIRPSPPAIGALEFQLPTAPTGLSISPNNSISPQGVSFQ